MTYITSRASCDAQNRDPRSQIVYSRIDLICPNYKWFLFLQYAPIVNIYNLQFKLYLSEFQNVFVQIEKGSKFGSLGKLEKPVQLKIGWQPRPPLAKLPVHTLSNKTHSTGLSVNMRVVSNLRYCWVFKLTVSATSNSNSLQSMCLCSASQSIRINTELCWKDWELIDPSTN